MSRFTYKAKNNEGKLLEGVVEAASESDAADAVRREDMILIEIRSSGWFPRLIEARRQLTSEDLLVLSEQLQTLTEGNLPLAPALRAMARDMHRPVMRALLEDVCNHLENGETLQTALGRYPGAFPPLFLSMIRAGEETNNLPGVLAHLSAFSRRSAELRMRLQEIAAYPLFLFACMAALILFVSTVIVPMFERMYYSFGRSLPLPTQLLLGFGRLCREHTIELALAAFMICLALWIVAKAMRLNPATRWWLDGVKLKLPLFGPVVRAAAVSRFSHVLGMLLENGILATDALELAGAAAGNCRYEKAGTDASGMVSMGVPISESLERSGHFRYGYCWILRQSEEQNSLERALFRLAESCERDAARWQRLGLAILGPLCLTWVGLVLGAIISSLFMPIFQLSHLVS